VIIQVELAIARMAIVRARVLPATAAVGIRGRLEEETGTSVVVVPMVEERRMKPLVDPEGVVVVSRRSDLKPLPVLVHFFGLRRGRGFVTFVGRGILSSASHGREKEKRECCEPGGSHEACVHEGLLREELRCPSLEQITCRWTVV
jgi:hypothetical protein